MDKSDWLGFEKLCAEVKNNLTPDGYRVRHSVYKQGKDSGVARQLDIVIDSGSETSFTFLDAKCYKKKVDVKDVEMVIGLSKDVRATKAGIVTTVGYTDAAYNVAKKYNLDVVVLVDTGDHPWKLFVAVPLCVSIHRYRFTKYGLRFSVRISNVRDRDPYTGTVTLSNGRGETCIADYLLDEIGRSVNYGFDHPACEDREFQMSLPIATENPNADFLILEGVCSKIITHHEKYITLSSFSGFVDKSVDSGYGIWAAEFDLYEIENWPVIDKPPKPINGVHPQFMSINLHHLRSDASE